MKRIFAFALAMMMALLFTFSAVAEDIPQLGTGSKSTIMVVVEHSQGEFETAMYEVLTDKETLMDALLEVELIQVEDASWGYNVVSVGDWTADYEKDGSYWSIYEYDAQEETFVRLEAAIDQATLPEFCAIAFVLQK